MASKLAVEIRKIRARSGRHIKGEENMRRELHAAGSSSGSHDRFPFHTGRKHAAAVLLELLRGI